MNVIKYNLFPGGAHHCITLSYDDGRAADIRLAELFRENGLKATFHLNSGRLGMGDVITADQIMGEIGAVINGTLAGRSDQNDITVYDSTGIALQDLICAKLLLDQAAAQNVGIIAEL